MDRISVIIPSYKPGEYIIKLINTLKNQTFGSSRYNVFIILNGPKDPYYEFILNCIKDISNFSLYYIEEEGVSNARNFGLSISEDRYLTFIDDDDYVSHNFLEGLYLDMIHDQSIDIVQSNFKTDQLGNIKDDYISKAYFNLRDKEYSLFSYRKFLSSVCGKLYKRTIIGSKRFDVNLKISEDSVFLFSISKNIKKMVLADSECVYFRCLRDGSTLRTKRSYISIFQNYFNKILKYTKIFFSAPFKYSFFLYCSRLVAVSKTVLFELLENKKYG